MVETRVNQGDNWTPAQVRDIVKQAKQEIEIRDRSYHFVSYQKCFIAQELTDWIIAKGHAADRAQAVRLCSVMKEQLHIVHVCRDHDFKDKYLFFRFMSDTRDKGHVRVPEQGEEPKSWKMFLDDPDNVGRDIRPDELKEMLSGVSTMADNDTGLPHVMLDKINCELYDNVRPLDWVDPEIPAGQNGDKYYDIIAIGGGAAGMVTTGAAAFMGGTALMIEKSFMGGDCLNTGCVPSKAFLKSASVAHKLRTGAEFGLDIGGVKVNFPKVMERMRKIRAEIGVHDSAENFSKEHGIDIVLGEAKFIDRNTILVNGREIKFFKACICTGGRPRIPNIPGIRDIPHYTSENIWNMTVQPEHLLIVGAGPVACELGQAFQRLGTQVTFLIRGSQFLPKEDQDAAEILKQQLIADGCEFRFETKPLQFELLLQSGSPDENSQIKVNVQTPNGMEEMQVQAVMLGVGRVPNVQNLGLEEAGVAYSIEDGVQVNNNLRTTNSNIYAAGDCCTKLQFTHHSDVMARTVVYNALLLKSIDINKVALPWSTFTDPEIATVGKTEQQLRAEGVRYTAYRRPLSEVDRAICDGATNGFVKVLTKHGKPDILGCTIVGGPAGDMISQITMGMSNKLTLQTTGSAVSPYPSYSDALKNVTDQYNKTRLTPFVKGLLNTIVKIRR